MQETGRVLVCFMPSDPPEKPKREDEAGARQKTSGSDEKSSLKRTEEKIPESEGNLRRRADWFQKRSGGTG
jgi:hypothetical protein